MLTFEVLFGVTPKDRQLNVILIETHCHTSHQYPTDLARIVLLLSNSCIEWIVNDAFHGSELLKVWMQLRRAINAQGLVFDRIVLDREVNLSLEYDGRIIGHKFWASLRPD